MPTNAEYEAQLAQAWTDLNAGTSALGARVQGMQDQINATPGDGLNGPQTEALLVNLASLTTTLNAMGQASAPPPVQFPTIK